MFGEKVFGEKVCGEKVFGKKVRMIYEYEPACVIFNTSSILQLLSIQDLFKQRWFQSLAQFSFVFLTTLHNVLFTSKFPYQGT